MIVGPFLLYLGHASNAVDIKTSRGLATFRREDCVGEFRHDDCPLSLGLPRLDMAQAAASGARTLILGIVNSGGTFGPGLLDDAVAALKAGLNVASGLHQRLRDEPRLVALAAKQGLTLHDVRDPPLCFRVGNGRPRAGHRLLTVGTDCSVGKMYSSLAIVAALEGRGLKADFRATGQTGIMIAGSGVPLDAVVADFMSGAIEQLAPDRHDGGWDIIEGQGSLSHPSFAGVSTGLLHGAQPEAIVLCHDPCRADMRGLPGRALPGLAETLEMNLAVARLTSPAVRAVGICLNTSSLDAPETKRLCDATEDLLGLPCTDPVKSGVEAIIDELTCNASLTPVTTATR